MEKAGQFIGSERGLEKKRRYKMSTPAVASGIAAKKILGDFVADLYDLGKKKFGVHFKRWKALSKIDSLHRKLRNVCMVKTIWQPEKAVDLSKFYYPSRVLINNKKKIVVYLDDFECNESIVIEGTVGQGKSIFLRYLTACELARGRVIPLFMELRTFRRGHTLLEQMLDVLKTFGLEMDKETFEFFAEEGKLILFLDAFDELADEDRPAVITELEALAKSFEALRIIITSRRESGIQASAFFRLFTLMPIDADEYVDVIRKTCHNTNAANQLIRGVQAQGSKVARLLTTPLIIALLVVRYRIDQTIPGSSIAFYDSLFLLLLERHDKTKAGYVRPRKSKLSDLVLQEFFSALSFYTRKYETTAHSSELKKAAREALKLSGQGGDAELALKDIVEITCLIQIEGDNWKFVHKSVQEYHAALFIKQQPDEIASRFYASMQKEANWSRWGEELEFLSEMDKYRYLKMFRIPIKRKIFGIDSDSLEAKMDMSKELVKRLIGGDFISGPVEGDAGVISHISSRQLYDLRIGWAINGKGNPILSFLMSSEVKSIMFELVSAGKIALGPEMYSWQFVSALGSEARVLGAVSVGQVLDVEGIGDEILRKAQTWLRDIYAKLLEEEEFVRSIEKRKELVDF